MYKTLSSSSLSTCMLLMVSFINSSYLFMIESLCFTIIGLDCNGQCCYLIVLNEKGEDFVSNYYELY